MFLLIARWSSVASFMQSNPISSATWKADWDLPVREGNKDIVSYTHGSQKIKESQVFIHHSLGVGMLDTYIQEAFLF